MKINVAVAIAIFCNLGSVNADADSQKTGRSLRTKKKHRPSLGIDDLAEINQRAYDGQSHRRTTEMPNIFEGDIMPTCYQIRQQYGEELVETLINEGKLECEEGERNLALLGSTGKLWDTWRNSDGVVEVPFLIDNEFDSIKQKIIVDAFDDLAEESGVVTFVKRSNQKPYLKIINDGGCWSWVGRDFTEVQEISLGFGNGVSCLFPGIIKHEMLHSLGFWHEQNRPDRDTFVNINFQNIQSGMASNFYKQNNANSHGSPYDYNSVMHYGKDFFSKNGEATITVKQSGKTIGQRNGPSSSDIDQLRLLYQCTSGPRTLSEYKKNKCTNECKCWQGATGCTTDNACQGDLVCSKNECTKGSPPNNKPTQEPSKKPPDSGGSKELCEELNDPFKSIWGDCSSYESGKENHKYCGKDVDKNTGLTASACCSQCNECIEGSLSTNKPTQVPSKKPTPAPSTKPTQAPSKKPTPAPAPEEEPTMKPPDSGGSKELCNELKDPFKSIWGDCSSYESDKENHKYCGKDVDKNTGLTASACCSQCNECIEGSLSTNKPTQAPSKKPTPAPSTKPTHAPSKKPTQAPSKKPTQAPSKKPTPAPAPAPEEEPTMKPPDSGGPKELCNELNDPFKSIWGDCSSYESDKVNHKYCGKDVDKNTGFTASACCSQCNECIEGSLSTNNPTQVSSTKQTHAPSKKPTKAPSKKPTPAPSKKPTEAPSKKQTQAPSKPPDSEGSASNSLSKSECEVCKDDIGQNKKFCKASCKRRYGKKTDKFEVCKKNCKKVYDKKMDINVICKCTI